MNKSVQYSTVKTYETHGQLNADTDYVWLLFHGFGQLADSFIKDFKNLGENHYVIALQAPSKFYVKGFTQIGASWLTQQDLELEKENVLNYIQKVYQAEGLADRTDLKLNLLGFSQGVSVMTRFLAKYKISFHQLICWAGKFPKELQASDFNYLDQKSNQVKVLLVAGKEDPVAPPEQIKKELKRLASFFTKIETLSYTGGHKISADVISQINNQL